MKILVQGIAPVTLIHAVGSDFDDSAAIALALTDPSLDIKLIVCTYVIIMHNFINGVLLDGR